MRYLSLFSGIEAATVAWHPLGWTPVAFAEIEPGPCSVLKHHYQNVPNLGDVTCITDAQIAALGRIDVVIGGSPCQDLSVAGKRAGLAGARSSLFHEQLRIFHAARHFCGARWLVWENVPGAFSSNAGRDFAVVAGAMAGLELATPRDGWGNEGMAVGENGLVEWCVLDAQWFGLAQRRKRVFAVLDTGDWANRPPVLLEPDRLRGDSAPRRAKGEGVTGTIERRLGRSGVSADFAASGGLIPVGVMAHGQGGAEITAGERRTTLTCNHEAPVIAFDCKSSGQSGFGVGEVASTMRSMGRADSHQNGGGHLAVAVALRGREGGGTAEMGDDCANALRASQGGGDKPHVLTAMQVRRLTPRECERLQGFPDDYTLVPERSHYLRVVSTTAQRQRGLIRVRYIERCFFTADGPRYKALGNSMATPVIAWIGRQIEMATFNIDAAPSAQQVAA